MRSPPLTTTLAGIRLRTPVLLAAGTAGTLDEMADALDLPSVGAIVTKSITRDPREGNPTWRVIPVDGGMLNAIGLANVGVEAFVRDYGPRIPGVACPVIISIAGFSIDDYTAVAAKVDGLAPAVELNVSCPNVHGGCEFSADIDQLKSLLRAVRPLLTRSRLFVKLSPIVSGQPSIKDIARAAIEPGGPPTGPNQRPGADGLVLANTIPAMAIDVETRRPRLANTTGGLSGPAVHPVAVKLVHEVYRAVAKDSGTPLVGLGGVTRWEHAAEFILAGATAVGVGTGLFADPRCPLTIAQGLEKWVRRQGVASISELVGAAKV